MGQGPGVVGLSVLASSALGREAGFDAQPAGLGLRHAALGLSDTWGDIN